MPFLDPYRATLQKFYPFLSNFFAKMFGSLPDFVYICTNQRTNQQKRAIEKLPTL